MSNKAYSEIDGFTVLDKPLNREQLKKVEEHCGGNGKISVAIWVDFSEFIYDDYSDFMVGLCNKVLRPGSFNLDNGAVMENVCMCPLDVERPTETIYAAQGKVLVGISADVREILKGMKKTKKAKNVLTPAFN